MTDNIRRRRSSFFPKPIEETSEKQLELFSNVNWIEEKKQNIISRSELFGTRGNKTFQEYSELLKCRKKEYSKLVLIKQEEQRIVKEKLRKNKLEINWNTTYESLTDFEREIANRPDYKYLIEKVHLLTLSTAVVKRAYYDLHSILNTYNEEIHKLEKCFIKKIMEDSGVGTSYNDSDTNSSMVQSLDNEYLNYNSILQE